MAGNNTLRLLEINVISARDLKDVNRLTTMDVCAEVTMNGDQQTKQRTPVHSGSGPNPNWNSLVKFTIDLGALRQNPFSLLFNLISCRMLGDRDIGRVEVNINQLFNSGKENEIVELPVISDGSASGFLKLSYRLGGIPATGYAGSGPDHRPLPAAYAPPSTVNGGRTSLADGLFKAMSVFGTSANVGDTATRVGDIATRVGDSVDGQHEGDDY